MTVLPVIVRELRASARHAFTYYLRALGAGALMLASLLFIAQHGSGPTLGGRLFASLHFTLFFAIWVLVPLLTADCLSRERREGTLGLLFLTRLKATDIVVAKSLAQGLRALSLWLAVLPVVTIPFLLGGVSWIEALFSALINFSAICWALAAGLLASAWSKTFLRSLLLSAILAISALFALAFGVGRLLWSVVYTGSITYVGQFRWQPGSDSALADGLGFVTNAVGNWSFYTRWGAAKPLLWTVAQTTVFSVFVLFLAILIAGARTRRVWQEGPPSQAQVWWEQVFCTPFLWLSLFRRWMRHKLERNPVGWLQQRTWTGRLVTWGWFAVTISLYSAVLTDPSFLRTSSFMQRTMSWLLAGSMALSAAGSFRRERETGVLELLLVSPLGERDIIVGRLRGLWGQFLPAVGLLLGIWSYFSRLLQFTGNNDTEAIVFCAVTFLTLPVIGLYFSLRCRGFLAALLSTFGVGLLLPMICPVALDALWSLYTIGAAPSPWETRPSGAAAFYQLVLAGWCWTRLYERLRKRAFPLERTAA